MFWSKMKRSAGLGNQLSSVGSTSLNGWCWCTFLEQALDQCNVCHKPLAWLRFANLNLVTRELSSKRLALPGQRPPNLPRMRRSSDSAPPSPVASSIGGRSAMDMGSSSADLTRTQLDSPGHRRNVGSICATASATSTVTVDTSKASSHQVILCNCLVCNCLFDFSAANICSYVYCGESNTYIRCLP